MWLWQKYKYVLVTSEDQTLLEGMNADAVADHELQPLNGASGLDHERDVVAGYVANEDLERRWIRVRRCRFRLTTLCGENV